jgi:hypothetical protein
MHIRLGSGARPWTLRRSLLDTQLAPHRSAAQPAAVIRMQIQARDLGVRRQNGRQLQLCVPQVGLKGDSYRLKDRDLGRVPAPAGEE